METNNKNIIRYKIENIDKKLEDIDFKIGCILDKIDQIVKYNINATNEINKKIKEIENKQNNSWFWIS